MSSDETAAIKMTKHEMFKQRSRQRRIDSLARNMCVSCAPHAAGLLSDPGEDDTSFPNSWLCLLCRVALTDEDNRDLLARTHDVIIGKLEELIEHIPGNARNEKIVSPKFSAKTQQYYRITGRPNKHSEWTVDLLRYNAYTDEVFVGNSKKPLCMFDDPRLIELLGRPAVKEPKNSRKIWYPFTRERYMELESDTKKQAISYDDMNEMLVKIETYANKTDNHAFGTSYGWKIDFPPGRVDGKRFINITNSGSGFPKYYVYARIDAETGNVYSHNGSKPYCSIQTLAANPNRV